MFAVSESQGFSWKFHITVFDSRFRLILKKEHSAELESYEWFQRRNDTDEPYSGKISERIWEQGMENFVADFAGLTGWKQWAKEHYASKMNFWPFSEHFAYFWNNSMFIEV